MTPHATSHKPTSHKPLWSLDSYQLIYRPTYPSVADMQMDDTPLLLSLLQGLVGLGVLASLLGLILQLDISFMGRLLLALIVVSLPKVRSWISSLQLIDTRHLKLTSRPSYKPYMHAFHGLYLMVLVALCGAQLCLRFFGQTATSTLAVKLMLSTLILALPYYLYQTYQILITPSATQNTKDKT